MSQESSFQSTSKLKAVQEETATEITEQQQLKLNAQVHHYTNKLLKNKPLATAKSSSTTPISHNSQDQLDTHDTSTLASQITKTGHNFENSSLATSQATQSHSLITVIDNQKNSAKNKNSLDLETLPTTLETMDTVKENPTYKEKQEKLQQKAKENLELQASKNSSKSLPRPKNQPSSTSKSKSEKVDGTEMTKIGSPSNTYQTDFENTEPNINSKQPPAFRELKKQLSRISSKKVMPVITKDSKQSHNSEEIQNSADAQTSNTNQTRPNPRPRYNRRQSMTPMQRRFFDCYRFFKMVIATFICVGLPLAVYVIDVVLTINVIEFETFRHEALDFTAGYKKPILPHPKFFNTSFKGNFSFFDVFSNFRPWLRLNFNACF